MINVRATPQRACAGPLTRIRKYMVDYEDYCQLVTRTGFTITMWVKRDVQCQISLNDLL